MSFIPPQSSTGPYTPNDSASGTQGHQLPGRQSQRPYDNIAFGARFGANVGQPSQPMPRFFPGNNMDISVVVASAPERLLEQNAFYMRLKLIAAERTAELNKLRETIMYQRKEFEALKTRCDIYQETIDLFSKNCVNLKTESGDAIPILLMANFPPTDMKKGETEGDSSTAGAKAKPGRPRVDSYKDSISEYFYLENRDGTTVSKEVISRMNQKAQAIWETLDEHGLAPTTFDKISETAWDYYARIMLNDPEFFFLRLCDDGQWLKEWSNSSYPSWYGNRGVRQNKANEDNLTQLDPTTYKVEPDDSDPGIGENGSEVICSGDEEQNTETSHPTSDSEKKRKAEEAASRSLKKQKGVEALAIPTDRNTVRNICMRHWNELQPGGQGLASEFAAYFKTLSDTDKEPFKREMRAVPKTTKKARTAAKKVGDTPPQLNA